MCVCTCVCLRACVRACVCAHLLREHVFLRLQSVAVLEALVAAGLSVAAVLERAAFLLQADHLVFAHSTQVSVELPHREADQLLVGEALVHTALLGKRRSTRTGYAVA